jgi:AAA15 family ATPase/GTPase
MAIVSEKMVFFQTQKSTELFSRSTDLAKRFSKIDFGSKIKVPVREKDLLESNTLHNNTVLGAYAKTNVDIPELEVLNKWFSLFLLGLITPNSVLDSFTSALIENNPEANVWINRLLNKADDHLVEVNVGSSEEALPQMLNENKIRYSRYFFEFNLKKKIYNNFPSQNPERNALNEINFIHKISEEETFSLPFESESSGTKKYFGLAGPLYQIVHYPQFLCIDELENSLHPDLMKYFLQVFLVNSKRSQLLITTHTTSLMDNEDFIRKDALWFCEKQSNGSINLYSAADFDTSTLRKDSNIQKAYKAGRLGAKPNLGSPYLESTQE